MSCRTKKLVRSSFSLKEHQKDGGIITQTITKKRKIELLIQDNKNLINENKKLQEQSNVELSNQMINYLNEYENINHQLYNKYQELNKLKWTSIHKYIEYKIKFMKWKIRKKLSI